MARYVKVVSVTTLDPGDHSLTAADYDEHLVRMLNQAGELRADLVVLPECVLQYGVPQDQWMHPEDELPQDRFQPLAACAAKHRFNLVIGTIRRARGTVVNSAVLVGRDGRVIGAYDKMFPTIGEIEERVVPGREATVLETDFGRIGFAICFDANFFEVFEGARDNGADLVAFPSMYRGGFQLARWAFGYEFPIIASCPYYSAIVDITGRTIAETGLDLQPVGWGWVPGLAVAEINLDRRLIHFDGHVRYEDGSGDARLLAAKEKCGKDLTIDIAPWRAGVCAIGCETPDRTIEDVAREFGIEFYRDYLARARCARDNALAGA